MESANPCVNCTSRPFSFRISSCHDFQERRTPCRLRHFHDQAQHFWNLGSAVNQITNENRSASIWRSDTWCCRSFVDLVTELNEQSGQLFVATCTSPMMSNGPCSCFRFIPKRLAHDRRRGNLLCTRQHEDMTEAFAFKAPEGNAAVAGTGF